MVCGGGGDTCTQADVVTSLGGSGGKSSCVVGGFFRLVRSS